MNNHEKAAVVTRGEFYSMLSPICLLLASALLGVAEADPQNMLRLIGYYILFLSSLGLGIFCAVWAVRERRQQSEQRDHAA